MYKERAPNSQGKASLANPCCQPCSQNCQNITNLHIYRPVARECIVTRWTPTCFTYCPAKIHGIFSHHQIDAHAGSKKETAIERAIIRCKTKEKAWAGRRPRPRYSFGWCLARQLSAPATRHHYPRQACPAIWGILFKSLSDRRHSPMPKD